MPEENALNDTLMTYSGCSNRINTDPLSILPKETAPTPVPKFSFAEFFDRIGKGKPIYRPRFYWAGGAIFVLRLFDIKRKRKEAGTALCRIINRLLPFLAVIALLADIPLALCTDLQNMNVSALNVSLAVILTVLGMIIHEAGHAVAFRSYGNPVNEAGMLLLGIIPCGAYVMPDDSTELSGSQNIQANLAGIECNLITSCLYFSLALIPSDITYAFFGAGLCNFSMALFNLLPAELHDGEHVLSAFLGLESVFDTAKTWIKSKESRRFLLSSGPCGVGIFLLFSCILTVSGFSKIVQYADVPLCIAMILINS